MSRRHVVILGSTGSIGTQALDVVRANPDRFRVVALTAGGSQRDLFDAQVAEFAPAFHGLGEDASVEAAAITRAPSSLATCRPAAPKPPAAPSTRTVSPACNWARSFRPCIAVT